MTTTATTATTTTIPVIHLNAATDTRDDDKLDGGGGDGVSRVTQVALLREACLSHGFFYLDGHGVDDATFQQVYQQSKALFELPVEIKQQLSDSVLSRGYTGFQEETLDPTVQTTMGGDTKEGYYIADDIAIDDPILYQPAKLMGPNVWPTVESTQSHWTEEQCHTFRTVMQDYYQTMMCRVGFQTVRLLALAIGLADENYFDEYFKNAPRAALRLLHYPPIVSLPEQGLFGCGAHSDYGMITLLWTDGNPGLQILPRHDDDNNNNIWIDVPPPPSKHILIVNLGDMLERWTNGMFKSTKHRVVMKSIIKNTTNDDENDGSAEGTTTTTTTTNHRYSIPFFYEPHFDTIVECLPVCCSDNDNPPKYPPVVSGEYLLNKYRQTHADFTPVNNDNEEEEETGEDEKAA